MKIQQLKACQPLKAQKAATPSFGHRSHKAAIPAAHQAKNLNIHA